MDSGSTADTGRFLGGVDEEGGSGVVCKLRVTSLSEVTGCRGVDSWDSVGGWVLAECEGTEMGLGDGEGGIGIDEERDPMLIGVAGFLEVPTVMGVDPLTETMFGITR